MRLRTGVPGRVRTRLGAALGGLAMLLATAACEGDGPAVAGPSDSASAAATDPARTDPAPTAPGPIDPALTDPAPTGPAAPSSASTPAVPVADPDHAVPPPGPRTGALVPADLLVASKEPLTEEMIEVIEATEGVTRVEQISFAQVVIENRSLNVVAVDPGTYRNFTPLSASDFQEVWDRVAGGEAAIDLQLKDQLPVDEQGYLKLGAADQAATIHVGAYADQVEGLVDVVVNEKWGEDMGMPVDNALLISTTMTAPDRVAEPLEKLLGEEFSVQRLDVVARTGIDPGAVQVAVPVGTVAEAVGHFTYTVSGGRVIPDPAWVSSHIATDVVPILGRVTCNRMLLPQLKAALQEIVDVGLAHEIRPGDYAGCYYPRFIANTTTLSNHAFGLALDINVSTNGRGIPGDMHPVVVHTFKKWGFAWGGDWRWTDPMHFEMARIVKPG